MSAKVSSSKSSRLPQLVRRSIKALEVAIDDYAEGTPKHNGSCVENCDKAVELILKAKVIDLGESIYVNPNSPNTIKMRESFAKLRNKGIIIPEEKKLTSNHLNHRNPAYHEGKPVSKARAKSVLNTTRKFMERFLKDEFNLKLKEIIRPPYLEMLDHKGSKTNQIIKFVSKGIGKANRLDQARIDVPNDYETIEIYLNKLAKKKKLRLGRLQQPSLSNKPSDKRSLRMSKIVNALVSDQTLSDEMREYFDTISNVYNKAVNTQEEITWKDYEPYALVMLRFKDHLELIQQAEQ
jgi:HEPN domain-containing protein